MAIKQKQTRSNKGRPTGARVDPALYEAWRRGQEWLEAWLSEQRGGVVAVPAAEPESAARHDSLCAELGLTQDAAGDEIVSTLTRMATAAWPKTSHEAGVLTRVRDLLDRGVPHPAPRPVHKVVTFPCAMCGEPNEVDIDRDEGMEQTFTIDCWVCCRPNGVHARLDEAGTIVSMDATLEQF